jgi:DNA-binding winged helix-turn-helix (wHTH) protein
MSTEHNVLAALEPTVSCWRFAAFEIDISARTLRRAGKEVPLRRKTWQLLCLLAANPYRLLTKAELMATLWPRAVVVDDSLVQCVLELRRALGDPDHRLLRTVARGGYRFDVEVQANQPSPRPHSSDSTESELLLAWRALAQAQDASQVGIARQLFEMRIGEVELRADAMAGLAMSHVIDVLNRWARCPAWNIALAHEAADESMSLDSTSARAFHARAHVAMLEGQHVEAFLGFRAALARNPSMARSRVRMGLIETELGRPEETFEHVRQAFRTGGDDEALQAQAFFIQGMAYFHLGMDSEASDCMQRVLTLRPASGLAHQWLASIYALGDRPSPSGSHLAAFCRYVPGHTIESLRSTERSRNPVFMRQRDRFYDGLRLAGLD